MGRRTTLDALRSLAIQDLDATSDEQLQLEMADDGVNAEALAKSVAEGVEKTISECARVTP